MSAERVPPRPEEPLAGEEVDLRVEKLVAGGDGLARLAGLPIFVPRSAPGDLLRCRLVERRRDYARAELLEILEPGPGRRQPPCPHFDRCGGCDLQHLEDARQLELKAAAVRETLERLGGLSWPESVEVVAGDAWGYRLRCRVRIGPAGDGYEVGYLARRSRELVPVERCPVLAAPLEALVAELPSRLPADAPRRVDLALGDGGALTSAPVVAGLAHGEISRRVDEFTYAHDARCFFQGHVGLLGRLVESVVGEWQGESAFDLYCGVGLFTLPLARRYGRVVAVEGDPVAARYARINARRGRLSNIEVEGLGVDAFARRLPVRVDRVVLDPPRRGLSGELRDALLRARPRRLTYVSCHAAALARDLRQLATAYRVAGLTLFDLFPQTGHMEVVAQLQSVDE